MTIKDVAEYAGVSVATVSRTLNNSGYVGKESRKKVEKAIQALEYYPNEVARSLFQKTSKMIGLLLPDISNPYFPLLAKGVEDCAQEKGYMVLFGNVEDNQDKEDAYVKFFSQYNISGVLSATEGTKNKNAQSNVPYVLLDRAHAEETYSVSTDDILGGAMAAQAIVDRKPKDVIVMVGPRELPGSNDRLSGALKVLNQSTVHYRIFETYTFQVDEAEQTAERLFDTFKSIDSIIANNDVFALAVMKEALKRGYFIPKDLQIIGYDDMPFSKYMYPGLSTIGQPAYQVGYQGAKMLFHLLDNKTINQERIKLEPHLVIRESLR